MEEKQSCSYTLKEDNLKKLEEETAYVTRSTSAESLHSIDSDASSWTSTSTTSTSRAKTYFCSYKDCEKVFTRPSLLTEHQLSFHQGIKQFTCDICQKSYSRMYHLERHLISHSTEKPFHCSFCNKGVTTKQQLKRHEITHTKSFKCTYLGCDQSFYKHPQLRSHILAVHEQKLSCKICSKTFQRPYRLKNHMIKHHNPLNEKPYQCSFTSCSLNFKTWSQLQSHIKNDHPKLKCPICGKPCVGEQGLQMHILIHDDSMVIRNWKCHTCTTPTSFAKKNDLVQHYIECHDNKIPIELQSDNLPEEVLQSSASKSSTELPSPMAKKRKIINNFQSIKSEINLENMIYTQGKSGKDLILMAAGKIFKCTFPKCYRTFKTEERFNTHISKHKIHLLKLKIMQEKSEETQLANTQQTNEKTASLVSKLPNLMNEFNDVNSPVTKDKRENTKNP
ncbi:hypothetical protein TBLA_0B04960 [Henningerozyma blattae CBS 6284]|uniref:Transcription factor IIIA n=1 Tax=Henningerozyma blattae (strain ATCC 34711 / CBS 6284 / DSM 70876 / NBRC 10599 / NRRL Y-10934 / UCD 77-7) TaxID=1071380 RepID=I2GYX9_HENB6|nr:hypothetical protein TBLA_0B04960 [Tetrapisispora blattae CBS 6284]CCH59331.1 hypothetical protein TBLA_0B04960 [Tetrapisispora blattae CBS 6284]